MYEYLLLTRKNGLFCLAINEPSPIFALTIIAIFSSTNVRSSVVRLGCFWVEICLHATRSTWNLK